MDRRWRPDFAPPLSSLQGVELGSALPERLSWRGELAGLSRLRAWEPGLHPTIFDGRTRSAHCRYPYVAQLAPSADRALLAVASSDARIEVHEVSTEGSESLRLSLVPADDKLLLSACAWASPRGNDYIALTFDNRGEVWEYDLQTCQTSRPSRVYRLFRSNDVASGAQKNTSDVLAVDSNCLAVAVGTGLIKLLDVRVKGSKEAVVGIVKTGMGNALISSEGMYIYAADSGEIALFDRRISSTSTGNSVKSFGGSRDSKKRCELARKEVGSRSPFSFLQVLPGGSPGCVAYQTSSGAVGYTDMAALGPAGVHMLETDPNAYSVHGELQLDEFGTTARALGSWFMKRRQCDISYAQFNRGWRVLAPIVSRPGVRVVSFGSGIEPRSFDIVKDEHYSCVHALHGSTEQLVLGAKNRVQVLETDFCRRTPETEATT